MTQVPQLDRESIAERLRELPSVDRLLSSNAGMNLSLGYGRTMTLDAVRQVLNNCRSSILKGDEITASDKEILERTENILQHRIAPTLRPVINATGVIVHTNLGRAVMSRTSVEAAAEASRSYSNLEYDLEKGKRGSRSVHAEKLLRQLTGAEGAHAVNNNAAAVLLMLSALCSGKEVIISRGQLIEIGGGFRVPDVMAQSGARLVEVGTTNRTHLSDYAKAIGDETAAIMVAHHSNFQVVGFTSEPGLDELASLAHERGILVLYDQGSGAVTDTAQYGLTSEVTVQESLQAGADIVAFSGDKLLGGPQAGILCGAEALIDKIKRHPLARAVRADKMCLAALSATLRAYVLERAESEIPVWRMIATTEDEVKARASGWMLKFNEAKIKASIRKGESTVGGGSLPGSVLPTWLVALEEGNPEQMALALRAAPTPVIGRIMDNRLLFDPRTVLDDQENALIETVIAAAAASLASGSGD